MIKVDNLTVRYKNVVAVDGISFKVDEGEIFGIIGPNGAGKTSTIECLEGLRQPSGGSIEVLGLNPSVSRRELYRYIGVQLQEASFPDAIKVHELCKLFSSFYSNPAPYDELLERFGLEDKQKAYVKRLSGGQRQKISIVVALIANPRIIFLDELTTGLDPQARLSMWELVKQLRGEGKTIFMTTHFMDEAEYLCDRVCMMVNGKIAAIGSVAQLVEKANVSQRISFKAVLDPKPLEAISGVSRVQIREGRIEVFGRSRDLLKNVVVYLAETSVDFDDLSFSKPGLEDVFLNITGYRLEETF